MRMLLCSLLLALSVLFHPFQVDYRLDPPDYYKDPPGPYRYQVLEFHPLWWHNPREGCQGYQHDWSLLVAQGSILLLLAGGLRPFRATLG